MWLMAECGDNCCHWWAGRWGAIFMWNVSTQGTSEHLYICKRKLLHHISVRWVRSIGGHQQGRKEPGILRTRGTDEQPKGRAHLYMKQLHKLTPVLTGDWDQIPESCGSAQVWGVRTQKSVWKTCWSGGRAKQHCSPPEREHRETEVASFSAIRRDGLWAGKSQIFLSHFPGEPEKLFYLTYLPKPHTWDYFKRVWAASLQYILNIQLVAISAEMQKRIQFLSLFIAFICNVTLERNGVV